MSTHDQQRTIMHNTAECRNVIYNKGRTLANNICRDREREKKVLLNSNGTRQSISIMGEHSFEVLARAIDYIEDSVCPSPDISTPLYTH